MLRPPKILARKGRERWEKEEEEREGRDMDEVGAGEEDDQFGLVDFDSEDDDKSSGG